MSSAQQDPTSTTIAPHAVSPSIRKAFVMAVNPGKADEYARRHLAVPAELKAVFHSHGVLSYSLFYYPTTRQVFGVVEVVDEALWKAIAQTEACINWWHHMSEIMPSNEDKSPAQAYLTEVFHYQ